MTGIEKWAIFLRYANHKDKKELLAQIMESEEGVRMGAEALENISNDRVTYWEYFDRLKFEADHESDIIYAQREGEKIGAKKVLDFVRQGYSVKEIENMLAETEPDIENDMAPVETEGA